MLEAMLVSFLLEGGPASVRMQWAPLACTRDSLRANSRLGRRQHKHCGLTGSWSSQVQARPRVECSLVQVLQALAVLSSRE